MPDIRTLEQNLAVRRAYQRTLCATNEGVIVLVDILNDLGYFSDDPQGIDPQRIAVANRILWKAGIWGNDPVNGMAQIMKQFESMTSLSSDRDLTSLIDSMKEES